MRLRLLLALPLLIAGLTLGPPVAADDEPPPTTTTLAPGAVAIGAGFSFTGAVIKPSDGSPPRTFDGYKAAVFVQSWIGEAFWGSPELSDPPAGVPVQRVDVTGTWGQLTGYMTVYYASDGTTAWISFPNQIPTPGEPEAPPPPETWFVAAPRVIDAYNGTATLVDSAGVADVRPPPTTATTAPVEPADTDSSSSSAGWLVAATAAAIAAAAVVVIARRRRGAPDLEPGA